MQIKKKENVEIRVGRVSVNSRITSTCILLYLHISSLFCLPFVHLLFLLSSHPLLPSLSYPPSHSHFFFSLFLSLCLSSLLLLLLPFILFLLPSSSSLSSSLFSGLWSICDPDIHCRRLTSCVWASSFPRLLSCLFHTVCVCVSSMDCTCKHTRMGLYVQMRTFVYVFYCLYVP